MLPDYRIGLFLCLYVCGAFAAHPPAELTVLSSQAEPQQTTVNETAQAEEIELVVAVRFRCPDPAIPVSLSIGSADSRRVYTAPEISDIDALELRLRVPAKQKTPPPSSCLSDDNSDDNRLIEDAYSAQLALRCESAGNESLIATSTPVSLRISCPPEPVSADANLPPETLDQTPSPERF